MSLQAWARAAPHPRQQPDADVAPHFADFAAGVAAGWVPGARGVGLLGAAVQSLLALAAEAVIVACWGLA